MFFCFLTATEYKMPNFGREEYTIKQMFFLYTHPPSLNFHSHNNIKALTACVIFFSRVGYRSSRVCAPSRDVTFRVRCLFRSLLSLLSIRERVKVTKNLKVSHTIMHWTFLHKKHAAEESHTARARPPNILQNVG